MMNKKHNFKIFLFALVTILVLENYKGFTQDTITATVNSDKTSELSNGIISMTINSKGQVNYFALNGQDLVNADNKGRFYFSYNNSDDYYELSPTSAKLARLTDSLAEVVYTNSTGELIIEQSYILLKDIPGVYCYITLKGNTTSVELREMRVVFRVDPDIFTYAYVSDQTQGEMVSPSELKEAETVMDATYQLSDGSIYTKYDWANYVDEDIVHGLCNDNYGIWIISSSDEYLNGGPMKQELMVHGTTKTPLILKMMQGEHFGASSQTYTTDDEKIYGPFLIYANSGTSKEAIIEDAKTYAQNEQEEWPYTWMDHTLYPVDRTTVTGQLSVKFDISPKNMMVVLAQPGTELYDQGKDYMFWSKADSTGNFTINNVRPGTYSLYVFATEGEMTDEIEFTDIEVSGTTADLGTLVVTPTKYENFLWQIGEADRTARGFKLADHRRAYGLWDSVQADLTYTIGTSTPSEDWYYAQTQIGTWDIVFDLDQTYSGTAYLTLGIAGAACKPKISVYVNNSSVSSLSFGNDASVYRSANQGGEYQKEVIQFSAGKLVQGENKISLKLTSVGDRGGLMYDVLKLEVGDQLSGNELITSRGNALLAAYPSPFNSQASVKVSMEKEEDTVIRLLDQTGRVLQTIYSGNLEAGEHLFQIKGDNLNNGIYFIQLKNMSNTQMLKLLKY